MGRPWGKGGTPGEGEGTPGGREEAPGEEGTSGLDAVRTLPQGAEGGTPLGGAAAAGGPGQPTGFPHRGPG